MASSMTLPADTTISTEDQLRALVERGFRFVHPTDDDGEIAAVVGVRVHSGVVDVVRLHGENDVHATRMPGDEADILAPRTVLWQRTGFVGDVLDAVLTLPDDHAVPRRRGENSGCWVPVRPGAAKWVGAAS